MKAFLDIVHRKLRSKKNDIPNVVSLMETQIWVSQFVHILQQKAADPPHYPGDERIYLMFRKYDETQTKLPDKSQLLRFQTSLLVWLQLFENYFDGSWLSQNPTKVIEDPLWDNMLFAPHKDKDKDKDSKTLSTVTTRDDLLLQLIQKATCDREGMFSCSECHSAKFVHSHTEQRARCDEGMTTVNFCSQCNKKWTVR